MIRPRGGYIALISMLILTAFILIIATTVALTSFLAQSAASGSYYKEVSHALAESCVQKALLSLAGNSDYAGGETVTVAGSDTCRILSVSTSGPSKVIQAQGSFQNAVTNMRVTVLASDLSITGWEEPSQF